ncbi:hypothetical protein AMTRI_Chr11g95610 [Amborella trichopoda]|uniref:Transcription repressor n=1 Tax=Amborella trichopoda TaxID=13333 RepID=U5CSG0_AMBTC|nr:hypothetical protein AMTR_s00030p00234860 [Amborella trichopoda]
MSTTRKTLRNSVVVSIGCSCRGSKPATPTPRKKPPENNQKLPKTHRKTAHKPPETSSTSFDFSSGDLISPENHYFLAASPQIRHLLPEHDYMSGENRESGWRIGESVAVVTTSENPYIDFSRSMVQMIVEKEIYDQDELRELLRCFLSLNSKEHHETIIRAFAGICKYNPGFVRNL